MSRDLSMIPPDDAGSGIPRTASVPMGPKLDPERFRIIQKIRRAKAEIEQYFLDVEHWNSIHPDEPIDGDPDGALKRIHDSYTECLQNEARIAGGAQ